MKGVGGLGLVVVMVMVRVKVRDRVLVLSNGTNQASLTNKARRKAARLRLEFILNEDYKSYIECPDDDFCLAVVLKETTPPESGHIR